MKRKRRDVPASAPTQGRENPDLLVLLRAAIKAVRREQRGLVVSDSAMIVRDVRNAYVQLFDKDSKLACNLLRMLGQPVSQSISQSSVRFDRKELGECEESPSYSLLCNGRPYSFGGSKASVLVGRARHCDVLLPQGHEVSRIAFMLFLSPSSDEVMLVDAGGLFGVKVFAQSSEGRKGELLYESVESKRKLPFFLEWHTPYIVEHSAVTLFLNPVQCIVCCAAPRQLRWQCGHKVTCTKCKDQCINCPVCRAPFLEARHDTNPGSYAPMPQST